MFSFWQQKWRSMFVKFSAAFILVGLIPLLALSYYSVQTFTGHVERYTSNNLNQMMLYMSYNLNSVFKDYDDVSQLMYTGRYDGFYEGSNDNQSYNVNELGQINSMPIDGFLKTIIFSDTFIRTAYFVRAADNKLFYQYKENQVFQPELLPVEEWGRSLNEKKNKIAIFPMHAENYYKNSDVKVITVGRNLIDISGKLTSEPKVLGTLYFDVDIAIFDQFFKELSIGENDELYVLDSDNNVFFSNMDVMGKKEDLLRNSNDGTLVLTESIPYLKGQVTALFMKQNLYEQLVTTRLAVYIAIFICAVVLIVMGAWFSRKLAAPISSLIKQMMKVESGNLDAQVEIKGNDEMGRLGHGFNRMVERLQIFINDAYVAEIKQKQAELNALKSQIRPHYLYNTLEVIRMNAVHNDADEVGDMILSLSNQLKYVIDYGEDWVTLQQELDHLRDYFYIIEVRYENRFELRVHISEHVDLSWPVLKLSLQPIVENAIQHGVRPKGKGTVGISVEAVEGQLAITVYDDGVGMEKEQLQRLNETLSDPSAPSRHVGIKNVHERIKTVCGKEYGLSISSRRHVGTSVHMAMPIKEGDGHH
ncbi:cache domain-containing sensor histidine kinase [Paenibacillus harenae]|uniref:Two-component system sensor histidine kinase YesM n=1 Tax=Paenibacillus harenae TaxID=306543 RepID=A0ABT9TZQ4_PAEHA|nr:sensor histidine kinase [Paenibacillus harenae]MDQ0111925.1 two-component system sensor histidine kinase YesM [Paenibacillus harenae]